MKYMEKTANKGINQDEVNTLVKLLIKCTKQQKKNTICFLNGLLEDL